MIFIKVRINVKWEQHKLDALAKFSKGKGYSKKDVTFQGYPLFLYGRLYTNYSEVVSDVDTYTSNLLEGSAVSNADEVVLPDSGETAEDIARASWINKKGIILGGGLLIIHPDKYLINSGFLSYSLSYGSNHKKLSSYAQGKSIVHIHSNDLKKLYIFYPSRFNEQSKIFNILNYLENLITLQQRKLEILIKLKQSFLTKIMANNIDKNPELYFNSASIKWLKQELSNLTIKEFKGNTKLNDTKTGKTEYLDAERLNGNVPLFIDKPINTLKSDILILWDGSKAGSVYYGFEGSLGSTLKAIRLNPKLVNSFFVYQQLKSKQDVIFNKYRTPNIPHVIKNFTKVYPIYFPSMAVQNKIARFLGNLDTLIEIQQKSIKDHKVIKKYLLQKLFI
ncbi:restriction endonuclease subunit S [Limosilactobacillus reuteri]|uniref:restriction endonuclease subunit S n=1 Tax=Limosilactobacillus reuteri TaxID=1598 RepID=UPI002D1FBD2D|nr:restriction endonuclease subunit S [Limosilactobacillus reuteri]